MSSLSIIDNHGWRKSPIVNVLSASQGEVELNFSLARVRLESGTGREPELFGRFFEQLQGVKSPGRHLRASDALLESLLVQALKVGEGPSYPIDPLPARRMSNAVNLGPRTVPLEAHTAVLAASQMLSAMLEQRFPDRSILPCHELPDGKSIEVPTKTGVSQSSQTLAIADANQIQ